MHLPPCTNARLFPNPPSIDMYIFEWLLGEHTNELGLIIMLSGNRYLFFIIKSKKFHNNNFLLALGAIDKKTFITLRGLWSSPNPSRTKSNFTNICFTCSICFMFHLFLNGGICISYLCFFYEKP